MKKSNYDLVKEVVKFYEDEEIMNDFNDEFEKGIDISRYEFFEFFSKFIDDMSESEYIKNNWIYVENGGDWSVLKDEI
jgi:hypothetical protein